MKIKKYIARNMPEALHQVREDLGEGAIILNTRQLRKNSRFNLDDSPCVEVTAAFDSAAEEVAPKTANLAAQRFARSMETRLGERPTADVPAPGVSIPMTPAPSPTKSEPGVSDVMENLRELRDALDRVERRSPFKCPFPTNSSGYRVGWPVWESPNALPTRFYRRCWKIWRARRCAIRSK